MAVAFDSASSTEASTTYSFTHIPVGTPTAAIAAITQDSTNRSLGVTYAGVTMTPLAFVKSPDGVTAQFLFGLPGPVSSAATVHVSFTGLTETAAGFMTVTGSSTTSPFGVTVTNSGSSGNASLSMTAQQTGSLTVAAVGNNQALTSGAAAWSGASTGTERWNELDPAGFVAFAGQTVTTTGLLSFSWVNNAPTSPSWGIIGVEITPPHATGTPMLTLLGAGI